METETEEIEEEKLIETADGERVPEDETWECEKTGEVYSKHFPVGLKYPAVVPTEEGNISLEWIKPTTRVELEVNFSDNQLELYATDLNRDTFVEQSFGWDEWPNAFKKISSLLG